MCENNGNAEVSDQSAAGAVPAARAVPVAPAAQGMTFTMWTLLQVEMFDGSGLLTDAADWLRKVEKVMDGCRMTPEDKVFFIPHQLTSLADLWCDGVREAWPPARGAITWEVFLEQFRGPARHVGAGRLHHGCSQPLQYMGAHPLAVHDDILTEGQPEEGEHCWLWPCSMAVAPYYNIKGSTFECHWSKLRTTCSKEGKNDENITCMDTTTLATFNSKIKKSVKHTWKVWRIKEVYWGPIPSITNILHQATTSLLAHGNKEIKSNTFSSWIRTSEQHQVVTVTTVAYGLGVGRSSISWNPYQVYFHMDLDSCPYTV
ncbi:uncharacterized protein [Setaria viridis]